MSILKIVRMGHPVLRTKARALHPSEIRSPKIQQFIDDMLETMKDYQGVGLAAPQVHEGLRLFVSTGDRMASEKQQGGTQGRTERPGGGDPVRLECL